MLRNLTRLAIAAVAGVIAVTAYTSYRIWDQGSRDDSRPADAIVVLGAAQYNGRPSPLFQARLDHAIQLYDDGIAPILIVTGGKGLAGDVVVRGRGCQGLRDRTRGSGRGDPRRGPRDETLESLKTVGAMLREQSLDDRRCSSRTGRTCCASCEWPATRASQAYGSPTTTSPTESSVLEQVKDTVHEIGGLGLYFLTGTGL